MTHSDPEQHEESHSWPPAFGKRLRAARERAGMSQDDVQERLGFPVRSITRWENGKSDPGFEKVVMMASLYGASTDWIAGRTSIEVCMQPGMILVDEDALRVLSDLADQGKRMSDVPKALIHGPGINYASIVPRAASVLGPEAAATVELRMRTLWQRLGGK